MRVTIYANPTAGKGRATDIASLLAQRLSLHRVEATVLTQHISNAPRERADAVAVVGGDGTLRGVVERLMCDQDQPPPVAHLPLGTANLMHLHLGNADGIDAAVARILAGKTRAVDVCLADTGDGPPRTFLLMAGVGIDAYVVHRLAAKRKGPIDKLSYAAPLAMALQRFHFVTLTLHCDGRRAFGPAPAAVIVANASEYGTGFPVVPGANSGDGVLDAVALPARNIKSLAEILLHVAAGTHLSEEGVVHCRGKHLRIDARTPLHVQLDGDPAGLTPIDLTLSGRQVRMLVDR